MKIARYVVIAFLFVCQVLARQLTVSAVSQDPASYSAYFDIDFGWVTSEEAWANALIGGLILMGICLAASMVAIWHFWGDESKLAYALLGVSFILVLVP